MTYTAVLKDEDRFLYIYEGDVYMGYLHDFTTVNIAKAFQDAINGVIPLNIASELFAEVDFVNEEDGGYYTIFIGDADDAWCFVGGCGHEEALELAEALIQQIKEQEGEVTRTVDEIIYLWDVEHTCIEHGALVQENGVWHCPKCEEDIPHCACGGIFRFHVFGGNVVYWCDKCGKEVEE